MLNKYIKLTDFETYSILWHMGIPENYIEARSYHSALKKYPEILLLQMADNMSSHMFEGCVE
jgi:hypothetical protein